MTDQDSRTISNMAVYGGGFVKALAAAARHADSKNLEKIKQTWPEYWKEYSDPKWGAA